MPVSCLDGNVVDLLLLGGGARFYFLRGQLLTSQTTYGGPGLKGGAMGLIIPPLIGCGPPRPRIPLQRNSDLEKFPTSENIIN